MATKLEKDLDKLRTRADEIDVKAENRLVKKIVSELTGYMAKNKLQYLAAPQIGHPYRIFCISYKSKGKVDTKAYINPIITRLDKLTLQRQSTPSLLGKEFIQPRYAEVGLEYQDETGRPYGYDFAGQTAFSIELMMDILDGLLPDEIGLEVDDLFDAASEEERGQLLEAYLTGLQEYQKQLTSDIESDPELKQLQDAIDYMQAVKEGRVVVEKAEEVERDPVSEE